MRTTFTLLLLVLGLGCGDDDGGTAVTCEQVCNHISTQCGATPPNCPAVCSGFSDAVRSCVVGATSCATANACATSTTTDAGMQGSDGGTQGTDAGERVCEIGQIPNCAGPSLSCTRALLDGGEWCSPTCDTNADCAAPYVCNGRGGYCVPACTAGNRSCPAPFDECEVAFGATNGYCR